MYRFDLEFDIQQIRTKSNYIIFNYCYIKKIALREDTSPFIYEEEEEEYIGIILFCLKTEVASTYV